VFRAEETTVAVPFRHHGSAEIWITGAETSCDCLEPRFGIARVPPGEQVELHFAFQSGTHGPFAITAQLRGRGPQEILHATFISGFVADRAWLIAPDELRRRLAVESVTVLDVRAAEQFARIRIPRSLNVPAFALKSRTALRDRNVVLVDSGVAPTVLLEQAVRLRQLGFKDVAVLEGGVPAWMRAGFAVDGTADSVLPVALISPAEFIRARSTVPWTLIELDAGGARQEVAPGAVRLAGCDEVEALLLGRAGSRPGARWPNTLIMAADIATYAHIEARLSAHRIGSIYYLAGGRAALDSHFAVPATLADGGRPILQTRSARAHGPAAAGCGSCPK
jgi:rhodanese-related sulfurtransferase